MRVLAFAVLLASHFATAETDWIAEARKLGRYDQEWKVEDWDVKEVGKYYYKGVWFVLFWWLIMYIDAFITIDTRPPADSIF